MTVLVAVLVAGALLLRRPSCGSGRRLQALRLPSPRPQVAPAPVHRDLRLPAAGVAGLGVALLLGLPLGLAAGPATAAAAYVGLGRLEPRATRERRERLLADLPLTVELVAACLTGGAPLLTALEVVAAATGGPTAQALEPVAAAIRLGAPVAHAWARLEGTPELEQVARAATRTADSGAALAAVLVRLAGDLRAGRAAAGSEAARKAGISAVGPLAACFLPAFLLIGVAPVVVGLVKGLLGSLTG